MKVLLGVDVDPVLPPILRARPAGDIWSPLDLIPRLEAQMGPDLPPMTWLLRVDQSIEFASGDLLSGYLSRRPLWERLQSAGHELGWHMHYMSLQDGVMTFDADPAWLPAAFERLSRCYPVHAVRTGWDYGSNAVFRRLREFGVKLDFSALPGALNFIRAGLTPIEVDWRRCPEHPYYPSAADYQSPALAADGLIELPITQFPSEPVRSLRRLTWRMLNGKFDLRGVRRCTRLLTEAWPGLPETNDFGLWAFFYHPDEITPEGIANVTRNIQSLRAAGAEFVTASQAEQHLRQTYAQRLCAVGTA